MSFIDKAKEKAGELAHKAGPGAAKGVDSAKAQLDKATGGKYHDRIENVSGKVQDALKKAEGWNEKSGPSDSGQAGSGQADSGQPGSTTAGSSGSGSSGSGASGPGSGSSGSSGAAPGRSGESTSGGSSSTSSDQS